MNQHSSRRQFGKQLAALTSAVIAAGSAAAQPAELKPRAAALEALANLVRARHGAHLSEEQSRHVRRKIAGSLQMADVLKRTQLHNGDEPDFTFYAD